MEKCNMDPSDYEDGLTIAQVREMYKDFDRGTSGTKNDPLGAVPLWVKILLPCGALVLAGCLRWRHRKKHSEDETVQQTSQRLIDKNREAYEKLGK